MTLDEAKNKLVKIVEDTQGIKGTDLICLVGAGAKCDISGEGECNLLLDFDLASLLENLVKEGRILEVEYILPKMNYRIKSMYFPVGTAVTVREVDDSIYLNLDESSKAMMEDRKWAHEEINQGNFNMYLGEYVAVFNKKVIYHSHDLKYLRELLDTSGFDVSRVPVLLVDDFKGR